MKPALVLLSAALLATSCSGAPPAKDSGRTGPPPVEHRPVLPTPTGAPVDAVAYNRIIDSQGRAHYCGSGHCDNPPRLVHGLAPAYPHALLGTGTSGHATVVFTIDEEGAVVDARIESATHPGFSEAALAAIRTWRFIPASLDGTPVRMSSRQQFPFELR